MGDLWLAGDARMSPVKDWVAWHEAYEDPASSLSTRLRVVQEQLARAVTAAAAGPVRLVSLCAGQGHDVAGALAGHPRRDDVHAVLVEASPRNAELARRRVRDAGLPHAEVREADASRVSNYADALPANVLLLCGIFGNVSDEDIKHTAELAPALCAGGATVIWTRHRRPPDLTPQIRAWFGASGFDEIAFESPDTETMTGVGVGRLRRAHALPLPSVPLFTFRAA
jgi:hypothetical protein